MANGLVKKENTEVLKLMPQSLEAEEAVLGAVLTNPASIGRVVEYLTAESFYKPSNALIFQTALELYKKNEPIDIVTVSELLRDRNELEKAGGRAYINDLAINTVTTANVEYYAKIIKEKAVKRALITAGNDIAQDAYENEDTDAALDNAQKRIFEIAAEKQTGTLTHIKDLVVDSFSEIEERFNNQSALTGVDTGFYDLNDITMGLQKTDLIILAARPAMGKTAFALNLARNAAIDGNKAVAIFSLEMSKQQLVKRMLCAEAEVNMRQANMGQMQERDVQKILNAMNVLSEAKIYINDTSTTVTDIKAQCRKLIMDDKDLGLIVIDYLQLMDGGNNKQDDRNQYIAAISRSLKMLAKELNVPILVLSQLNRGVESRTDKRPMLSDLRDSGAIEQDADIVMFIHRDEYYNKDNDNAENKFQAEIIIAKHRNGATGTVYLNFFGTITKFKNKAKPADMPY